MVNFLTSPGFSSSTALSVGFLTVDCQADKQQHGQTSLAKRKQAFETEYADWIADQNDFVDTHGIYGADMHPW